MNLFRKITLLLESVIMATVVCAPVVNAHETNALPTKPLFFENPWGIAYTNFWISEGPWSVHAVRLNLESEQWNILTTLAQNNICGLSTLTELVSTHVMYDRPLAAINGDFFLRDGAYAGDPRGTMIWQGQLVSAPAGTVTFWMDEHRRPHAEKTVSRLRVIWPDASSSPLDLNSSLTTKKPVLYNHYFGESTKSAGSTFGREYLLEKATTELVASLTAGETFEAYVTDVRFKGSSILSPNVLALTIPWPLLRTTPTLTTGDRLKFVMETLPDLSRVESAISAGPMLVVNGRQMVSRKNALDPRTPYSKRSMWERHPRTALGWNRQYLFLVVVDGRSPGFSEGMTLNELSRLMLDTLDCTDAMNLDGGGSTSLWYEGEIRNQPSDWKERLIANGLLIFRDQKSSLDIDTR